MESGELLREGTKGVLGEGESKLEVRKQKLEMGEKPRRDFIACDEAASDGAEVSLRSK